MQIVTEPAADGKQIQLIGTKRANIAEHATLNVVPCVADFLSVVSAMLRSRFIDGSWPRSQDFVMSLSLESAFE